MTHAPVTAYSSKYNVMPGYRHYFLFTIRAMKKSGFNHLQHLMLLFTKAAHIFPMDKEVQVRKHLYLRVLVKTLKPRAGKIVKTRHTQE